MAVLYSPFAFAEVLSELGRSKPWWARVSEEASAAFGRLCVETIQVDVSVKSAIAYSSVCVLTVKCNFAVPLDCARPEN